MFLKEFILETSIYLFVSNWQKWNVNLGNIFKRLLNCYSEFDFECVWICFVEFLYLVQTMNASWKSKIIFSIQKENHRIKWLNFNFIQRQICNINIRDILAVEPSWMYFDWSIESLWARWPKGQNRIRRESKLFVYKPDQHI